MAKKYAIPTDIMLDLRQYFFGRRTEIAEKAKMHYNSVTTLLKGERYVEPVMLALIEILESEKEDEDAFILLQKVVKLYNTKRKMHKNTAA